MSHTTKSTVQCHLDSKKHQVAVETMQKREKARVERRLEAGVRSGVWSTKRSRVPF